MTVYGDILFLVNFSLNWFSLLLCSKILKRKSRTVSMITAAALGAICGVLTVFFESTYLVALCEIASSFLMCAVAFGFNGFLECLKICSCLFASAVTIGGSLTLLYSFFNRSGISLGTRTDISAGVFLMISLGVTLTAMFFNRFISSAKNISIGKIEIVHNKLCVTLPFLCDSGNLLCDPISGKCAIVVKSTCLEGIVAHEFLSFDPAHDDISLLSFDSIKCPRIIPAKGICGKTLMLGFVPDELKIITSQSKKDVDAIIAIDISACMENTEYKAIVPQTLI